MKRALALVLAASLALGCTPATRRYAGLGIAGAGVLTTIVGATQLSPCTLDDAPYSEPVRRCVEDPQLPSQPSTRIALPLMVAGLSAIFLGSLVFASSFIKEDPRAQVPLPAPIPASSQASASSYSALLGGEPAPLPLDAKTACLLVTRYLERPEFSSGGPFTGFEVVSCRGPMLVAESRAELVDVYLRNGATLDEQRLTVCFEHHTDWLVTSVGTRSCDAMFVR